MRIRQLCLVLFLCGSLGACSSGGGDTAGNDPGALEHIVRDAAFESLTSRLQDAEITATLPDTGTAIYTGYIGATADLPGGGSLFFTGEAEMTARFAAGTVSGRFDRFLGPGGDPVGGSAVLGDGRIGPAGISADVTGDLTAAGSRYTIDGTFSGTFLGSTAESAAGVVDATLSAGASVAGALVGEVWLER